MGALKIGEALLVAAMAFALSLVFTVATGATARGLGVTDPLVLIPLSVVMVQGVAFFGIALTYLWIRRLDLDFLKVRMPSLIDVAWIVLGFGLLVATVMVLGVIFKEAGIESAQNVIQERSEEAPVVFLLLIPLSFLLVGPGEELVFRGVIQGSLREYFGPVAAIGIASVIFASIHLPSLIGGGSRLVYILVVFGLSLILGVAYERTDNIVVPSVIHGAYNALQFLVMYLVAKGLVPSM